MTEAQQRYITMDGEWFPKMCPSCKDGIAIGHGWLFEDPPPASKLETKRKAVAEVFMHDDSDDCILLTNDCRSSPEA